MKETDLYRPLKRFIETHNYVVKGEVEDCGVVAEQAAALGKGRNQPLT